MSKDQALRLALEALEEIALAGMSPAPEMIDSKEAFHARQAWRFIGIAARALVPIKQALANEALDRMADNERELGIQMQPEPPCKTGSQCTSKCEGCAEPEPVIFYRCKGCDTAYEDAHPTSCDCMEDKGFERTEYFTSPPKREPLTEGDITEIANAEVKPLPGADWTVTMRRMIKGNTGVCSRRKCLCRPEDAPNCIWWDEPEDAPPPKREWQGLTDEELIAIYETEQQGRWGDHVRGLRAIEAKLKEKNT